MNEFQESKETPFTEWDPNATCISENFPTTGKQDYYTCEGLYPWIYVLVALSFAILLLLLSPCSTIRDILCAGLRTIGFRKRKEFRNERRKFIDKHLEAEKIMTPLISQELVTMNERDYIMDGSGRNSKSERLLHIMDLKDEDSYRRFCVVVEEAYPALAEGKAIMSVAHRRALMVCRADIVKDLDVSSTCITLLYSRDVLSDHDKEDILATPTRYKQCEKFLDILWEKNDDAFDIVVDVLRKSNYKFLAEELIKEVNNISHYKEADVPDTNTHKQPCVSDVVIKDLFEGERSSCPQKNGKNKYLWHGKIISMMKNIQDFRQYLQDNLRKPHRPTDAKQEHEQYVKEASNPPRGMVTQKTWIFTHLNGGFISLDKCTNALSRLGVSSSGQDLNNLHNATFKKFLEILKDVAPECHEKCPVAKSSDGHS